MVDLMSVKLTAKDKDMLSGLAGAGVAMAMRIIVRMADVVGAGELMDITQAHIDGCGLLSQAGIEFAERLVEGGAKVSVPTTLNMGPLDLQNHKAFDIDPDFAADAVRQSKAYTDMGCIPTWTCAPYQGYLTPRFGRQIAWGESNAVAYANSVLGARTNRYGDYIDICAAITGRVPAYGLHLAENRRGRILLRLIDLAESYFEDNSSYAVLGHYIGKVVADSIPVIEGLPQNPSSDQLKAFCAAVASSGGVAMFHMVGITPEALTVEDGFGGSKPESVINVTADDLAQAKDDLNTAAEAAHLDAVVVGCPHFSFEEFRVLTELVRKELKEGRTLHEGTRFIVITSQTSRALVERTDFLADLARFGVEITLDTCVFHTPMISRDSKTIMTDSGKCAYYAPGELDVAVAFGTITDCVKSAVAGYVCRKETP